MLSQLNLRFHKRLIDALKKRAASEQTSVNALAERFIDDGLKTATVSDNYLSLVSDPDATVSQLYRRLILGQSFGVVPVSRDELRFMVTFAREGYLTGRNRLASLPALRTMLEITHELLIWQTEHDMDVDQHYLQGTFRLTGEDLPAEYAHFLTDLRPVIDQDYAECLLRPLACGCFDLTTFPSDALNQIFTLTRLQQMFPLVLRGLRWSDSKAEALVQELRPLIPAVVESIKAGSLRLDIRIDGQPAGQRPGTWYEMPRLHLLITGQDFVVPYGWEHFSELLGVLTLYAKYPNALKHGHQGDRVMFSPPGNVSEDGFFGLDGLRVFLQPNAFASLVGQLTARAEKGALAESLTGLRSLYGDL
ncbi:hypothetical protein [Dickeya poaceiphila]|uniref:Transcriptional regulator n=1 Tax=Dickeya poaceiphila TaxID=568768 RepID=A0A5B8HP70_9GAMM|nr:hypothetical protein [Dickeya poaceiphila]QDX30945.1 transcriptional regulator [Dickeya poaceiphila]